MKKALSVFFVSLACTALLFSQSLVEISKKEKERREQFKGKNVRVITNADLEQMDKKPAVMTTSPGSSREGNVERGAPESPQAAETPVSAEPQEMEPAEPEVFSTGFATAVLPETLLVENPEFALYSPDGKFADISFSGFLDLEFSVKNGPGDDIAIYARRAGTQEGMQLEEGIPANLDGSALPGALQYGVLVMGDSGDWEAVGQGMGINSPDKFDLGRISNIKKIRIVFRPYGNVTADIKPYRLPSQELSMGIDAVVALH
jgi:hypothetical protein